MHSYPCPSCAANRARAVWLGAPRGLSPAGVLCICTRCHDVVANLVTHDFSAGGGRLCQCRGGGCTGPDSCWHVLPCQRCFHACVCLAGALYLLLKHVHLITSRLQRQTSTGERHREARLSRDLGGRSNTSRQRSSHLDTLKHPQPVLCTKPFG